MSDEHRSPLGNTIDSLAESYKQLLDATLALNVAEVPYAICGGFAVAAWCLYHERQLLEEDPRRAKPITLVNTRDVDILVRREDLDRIVAVMRRAGFEHYTAGSVNMFVRKSRVQTGRRATIEVGVAEGIHLLFAGETSDRQYLRNPQPEKSVDFSDTFWGADHTFRLLCVEELVKTKLNSVNEQRLKDLIHLVELWESEAITDEVVRNVAYDAEWFERDRIARFHKTFKETVAACAKRGLRRYAMRGEVIAEQFDNLMARATTGERGLHDVPT